MQKPPLYRMSCQGRVGSQDPLLCSVPSITRCFLISGVVEPELTRHAKATILQTAWRRRRQQNTYRQQRQAVIRIQAAVRGCISRTAFLKVKSACLKLQSWYRSTRTGRAVRQQLLAQHAAAVIIQASWRGHRQRVAFLNRRKAAITVQAYVRGHQVRAQLATEHAACRVIQLRWLARQEGRAVRRYMQQRQAAVLRIQACWTGYSVRKSSFRPVVAAVTRMRHGRARRRAAQAAASSPAAQQHQVIIRQRSRIILPQLVNTEALPLNTNLQLPLLASVTLVFPMTVLPKHVCLATLFASICLQI